MWGVHLLEMRISTSGMFLNLNLKPIGPILFKLTICQWLTTMHLSFYQTFNFNIALETFLTFPTFLIYRMPRQPFQVGLSTLEWCALKLESQKSYVFLLMQGFPQNPISLWFPQCRHRLCSPFFVLKLEMINDPGCPPMPATTPPLYDHHHVATSRTPESRWPIFRGSPTSTETAVIVIYTWPRHSDGRFRQNTKRTPESPWGVFSRSIFVIRIFFTEFYPDSGGSKFSVLIRTMSHDIYTSKKKFFFDISVVKSVDSVLLARSPALHYHF